MIAEIFYHEGQELIVHSIREALLSQFAPALELEIVLTMIRGSGETYKEVETKHHNATRYVQLVLASVVPGTGLQVTGIVAYGFYIYSTYFGRQINFQNRDIEKLFPAVAMHEQMMLIPENLGMTIGGTTFWQIEQGGVIPVDFGTPQNLASAASRIKELLRSQAVGSMRNYRSYHKDEPLDFDNVAPTFGFDPTFVKWALQREAEQVTLYHDLSCECEPLQLHIGRWTRVKFTIRNSSANDLSDLTVQIRGSVSVLPDRIGAHVPANGSTQIDVALQPKELGELPVEILFATESDRVLERWLPSHHAWFSAIESA